MNRLLPMSERVPVDETLQALEYIRYERDKEAVRQYIEDVMPFGESTSIKYRRRFFERYLTVDCDQIVYTPFLKIINEIQSYQTKKELLFYMTVVQTSTLQVILKDIFNGVLKRKFSKSELMEYLRERMSEHKESSIEKTMSVLITILKDFNILLVKEDFIKKEPLFIVNERIRPTNEAIAFCLYYEFFEIQDNLIPYTERVFNADLFQYFLVDKFLAERYIKWLITNGFIEYYRMGTNEQFHFVYPTLNEMVDKVVANA
jgi:hypothetical protein